MSVENEAIAHRWHMDIFQDGKFDVADEIISINFINHAPGIPSEWRHGPIGPKNGAMMFRKALPDIEIIHEDTISDGDKVVIRFKITGTHEGEMFGIRPTGRKISWTGISIYKIRDAKIVEHWSAWDQLGVLQTLDTALGTDSARI